MNKIFYVMAFCLAFAACSDGQKSNSTPLTGDANLANQLDSISYAMGIDLAKQMKELGVDLIPNQLMRGFKDFAADEKGLGNASNTIRDFSGELRVRQGKPFTADDRPKTNMDSLCYALGFDYSGRLIKGGVNIDGEKVVNGAAAFLNNSAALDSTQVVAQMKNLTVVMRKAADAKALKNEAAGKAFLEENAKKEGVKATASGLQYKVIKAGDGPSPKAENTVKVHYEGRLIDGTVFDSSIKRGEPIEFPLGEVIPGWTEGLQLMKTGAKYQFYIPQNLAYGPQGPPSIGPMQALIFDVELLEVK